jgi:hypothetical protein
MSSENFWGDLSKLEIVRTPKNILMEQANFLTNATEGLLIGQVDDERTSVPHFRYSLEVRVPGLNNYIFTIIAIDHSLELYPVEVYLTFKRETVIMCHTQNEFESLLKENLASKDVRLILSRLLSQVR